MPVDRVPDEGDAEVGQRRHRARHQPLAAGLVDDALAGLDDGDVEAGPGGVQGGGQPDRAAAGDEQVTHRRTAPGSVRSAAFSTRIRTASRTALSSVKTSAVIHAACTSGSATPSTTTAT